MTNREDKEHTANIRDDILKGNVTQLRADFCVLIVKNELSMTKLCKEVGIHVNTLNRFIGSEGKIDPKTAFKIYNYIYRENDDK